MPWDIIAIPAILALIIGFKHGKRQKEKMIQADTLNRDEK